MVALVEAPEPLGHLGTVEQPVEALGLDPQPLVERAARAAVRGLLVGPQRRLGEGGERVRQLARPGDAGAARHDLVDQPDPLRLGRVDHAAGEDQLHRHAMTDDPRQPLRAAVAEADVPAPAGDAERGVLVGDAEVGPARPLEPAGVGDAVDGGDRRLVRSVQRVGPIIPGRSPRTCAARSSGAIGTTSSPANASLRSPPAQNASSPAPVRMPTSAASSSRKRVHAATSSRRDDGPDRVHPLGPVDRDHRDGPVLLVAQMLVAAHRSSAHLIMSTGEANGSVSSSAAAARAAATSSALGR